MFQSLFALYKKNGYSERSPLEDFNTEAFAGILQLHPIVFHEICQFLELPQDIYRVKTQVKYALATKTDCIVDLVFIGESNICFIENKVNSGEGWEQLERYCDALDLHFTDAYTKRLVYCTKFADPKSVNRHDFRQIRWFEIARILKRHSQENPLISNYIHFLNIHQMAQENIFTNQTFIAMEYFYKTYEVLYFHIENAIPAFKETFGRTDYKIQNTLVNVREHDRFACYFSQILADQSDYCEILYSIHLSTARLNTQIFINKKHRQADEIYAEIRKNPRNFKHKKYDFGISIWLDKPIYEFLNDDKADVKIKSWFAESFVHFAQFIHETPQFGWNLQPKIPSIESV